MSYMTITCAWCGQTYTTGVVGNQMVGTGHSCATRVPCESDDCDQLGIFQLAETIGPDGYEGLRFACSGHLSDDVVVGCQPGADV